MIQFVNSYPGFRLLNRSLLENWLVAVAKSNGKSIANIQYNFCSDEEILNINKTFLKHDYYTDIITFDYSQNNDLEAEIFISIDTVRSNSDLFHVKPTEELHRVIVHGLLHLIGFADKTKSQAQVMREQENKWLLQLNKLITKHKAEKAGVSRETAQKHKNAKRNV